MDIQNKIQHFIDRSWDESIIPSLIEFIKIPNKSPAFDPEWEHHGHMEQAVKLLHDWALQHPASEMEIEIIRLPGRTPLLYIDIPGDSEQTILLYGHLDKQPEMSGWSDGLGPWQPKLIEDKLYGRGGADDGYAIYAALTAINALQAENIPHAHCQIIIEACEESGSFDLPFYLQHLKDRLGQPDLVICLDSGAGNYDQLWVTTSLRGIITGNLEVEILTEGVHSGNAGGIVPSSFRILRQLLSRIEDEKSGASLLSALTVKIPTERQQQAADAAKVLKNSVYTQFPFVANAIPEIDDPTQLILNRTWRPSIAVIGARGLPDLANAGNVLRPKTAVKLALRVPPNCDGEAAALALKTTLENNPPYGAKVNFEIESVAPGWNAPAVSDWLLHANQEASLHFYQKPAIYMGEGGTIPFMGMLGREYPHAQFLITGVLGPHSNAHGPNEFLHIPMAKRVTACCAYVIMKHYQENSK